MINKIITLRCNMFRETVTGLATITEDIQSKTEQVWAVVQGMEGGVVAAGPGIG